MNTTLDHTKINTYAWDTQVYRGLFNLTNGPCLSAGALLMWKSRTSKLNHLRRHMCMAATRKLLEQIDSNMNESSKLQPLENYSTQANILQNKLDHTQKNNNNSPEHAQGTHVNIGLGSKHTRDWVQLLPHVQCERAKHPFKESLNLLAYNREQKKKFSRILARKFALLGWSKDILDVFYWPKKIEIFLDK